MENLHYPTGVAEKDFEKLNQKMDLILEILNKPKTEVVNQNEATKFMNFKDVKTFKNWADKNNVPFNRQGRLKMYQIKDLEWALDRAKSVH